jgi:hypothetical protein
MGLMEWANAPEIRIPASVRAITRVHLVANAAVSKGVGIPMEEIYFLCDSFDREAVDKVFNETDWFHTDGSVCWFEL